VRASDITGGIETGQVDTHGSDGVRRGQWGFAYASSYVTMCYTVKYMRVELPVCGHYYGCLLCG
jgi:hypothetical protein